MGCKGKRWMWNEILQVGVVGRKAGVAGRDISLERTNGQFDGIASFCGWSAL
jgi:hypothetical protein